MLAKLHQSVIKNQMGKMGFGMSFHFQNVVLFQNVFSFSKCERFRECFFLFPKNTIVNKNL